MFSIYGDHKSLNHNILCGIRRFSKQAKDILNDDIPKEVPKPFTTPPGFKPPSIGEQWRYAVLKHPYYRYGYSAVILVGIIGYVLHSTTNKDSTPRKPHSDVTDNNASSTALK